jgi:CRISPR-associated protein Cas1
MGTLYIDRKGYYIKADGETIAFYVNGKREGAVPVRPLKRVTIVGNNTIDTAVLHKLLKIGATVLFLSGRRLQFMGILRGKFNSNGILRLKQYEMSINGEFTSEFARQLLLRKIRSQKIFLEEALKERRELRIHFMQTFDTLDNISEALKKNNTLGIETLRGYEGAASNAYFSAFVRLFPEYLKFEGRNRRPPRDPVNAMLSLCYTMLYYEIVSEIHTVGLDPTIGFYHQFDYGRDSLACDIEELFRPEVDRFVLKLFRQRYIRKRDFVEEKGGVYLKKGARTRFYPLYEAWVVEIRRQVREELRDLSRRITGGKDPLSR